MNSSLLLTSSLEPHPTLRAPLPPTRSAPLPPTARRQQQEGLCHHQSFLATRCRSASGRVHHTIACAPLSSSVPSDTPSSSSVHCGSQSSTSSPYARPLPCSCHTVHDPLFSRHRDGDVDRLDSPGECVGGVQRHVGWRSDGSRANRRAGWQSLLKAMQLVECSCAPAQLHQ